MLLSLLGTTVDTERFCAPAAVMSLNGNLTQVEQTMAFKPVSLSLLVLSLATTAAHAVDVTVAYQTAAEPAKVAQAENSFAKLSGAKVDWRKFDSGSSVVRALASGDVQIGNLGSSPLAVAASQQVPIEVFLLASQLGSSEALVVKKDIKTPQDLIGKRIAVPFISTTHYSLLAALKHWGIKPDQVTILNLQPPAIAAAWQRGDIDGAYVWAPTVNELAKTGQVLTDSAEVGRWGAPTLDVWVVRKDFAKAHPEVVTAFARSALDAQQAYLSQPNQWLTNAQNLQQLSRLSGVPEVQIPELVKGNTYLPVADQITQLGKPVDKAIADTAAFLNAQGKIPQVAEDYSDYVTDRFVKAVQAAPQP
ncbi:taurine transporter substrate binding subunit [Yersinia nurmii]|uniref:Taurine transporter substrate binding subunit n=2 Tax=Yersinia nurmii TaxID=685706 RepID=A0ABP1YBF2_9GAMM|nr:taurine transporter substrate binding subunit [Yersinia nurmii]